MPLGNFGRKIDLITLVKSQGRNGGNCSKHCSRFSLIGMHLLTPPQLVANFLLGGEVNFLEKYTKQENCPILVCSSPWAQGCLHSTPLWSRLRDRFPLWVPGLGIVQ